MNAKWKQVRWAVAAVAAVSCIAIVYPDLTARIAYGMQSAGAAAAAARLSSAADISEEFADVAEVIRPSVVSVSSVKRIHMSARQLPDQLRNSPFRDFFGDRFFDRFFAQPSPRDRVQRGLGTGVIVGKDGYVLTNNHVVREADEVSVKLSDGRSMTAKVVGTDPKTDLAVLKIDADNLHPAKLGDSDRLKIGEWVVAAGNPFGLSASITAGIVSAKGRSNVGIADYEDFIQTDAAINPGNSGGPLVNLRGEVIGINTAIFTRSGGYMGIGFAIPINMAKSIMKSLIDDGHVVRGWLGVLIQDLNEGLAKSFGYEGDGGALIGDVVPGSPADKAGLKAGDIVVSMDGRKVKDMNDLRSRVADTKPGTKTIFDIVRDGKKVELKVKIGELEAEATTRGEQSAPANLGMTVRTVTPEIARQLGEDTDLRGVVVTEVEPLSAAERAGLLVKDVIVSVQGVKIDNVSDFRREIEKHDPKQGVRLGVRTGGQRRFVFLQMEK